MKLVEATAIFFALLCGGAALIAGGTLGESVTTSIVAYLLLFPIVVVMLRSRLAADELTDSGKSVSPRVLFNIGWSMVAVYSAPSIPLFLFSSRARIAAFTQGVLAGEAIWYIAAAVIALYWGTWVFKLSLTNGFILGAVWVAIGISGILVLMSEPISGQNHRVALASTKALGSVMAVVTGLSHIHKHVDGIGGRVERAWYQYLNLAGFFKVKPKAA